MLRKIIKIIFRLLVILISVFLATFIIPIKFCISSLPTDSKEDYYVIQYSRSQNRCFVIGDRTGLFNDNQTRIARPAGDDFPYEKVVSVDLYMQGDATIFIVYGSAIINDEWDEKYYGDTSDATRYTINSTHWDMLGKIHSMNPIKRFLPKTYLNLYDLRWFDILRDKQSGYLDGATNF